MKPPPSSRAAVFDGKNDRLEVKSFLLPELKRGEALVKISCCTICGSDLHTVRGDRPVAGPTILGHEIIGHIVELGSELRDVAGKTISIGDRITWSVAASCGECFYCQASLPQKCVELIKYGHEVIDGKYPLSGGLAEHCHLSRGTAVVKVPDAIPDVVACPANCATATVAAALRVSGNCRDKTIVIHGAGMLGLTAAAMSRRFGAKTVIVSDIVSSRRELAESFGATLSVNASDGSIQERVQAMTDGRGADIALEMSGANSAIEQSLDLLRIGGRLILVGTVFPTDPIAVTPERIVRKLLRIEGVHNYTPKDLAVALQFLGEARSEYPFEELIDVEYRLTDVNDAIRRAMSSEVIRVAVRP